jgi:hypothetical protein
MTDANDTATLNAQARHDVERARRSGDVQRFLNAVRRHPAELIPFDWVRHLSPAGERSLGIQTIPTDKIVGSVDRYREFDRYYLPRESHLDERWINVRRAQLQGRELPPISVYKVGELYFVKDGNHRVSVARRQGQAYIDAAVIELDVPVGLSETDTLRDAIIKGEYAQFLRATRLDEVVPDHSPVIFTTPGRYERLLEHIHKRQYYLDRKPGRPQSETPGTLPPVTWEEAVGSWYRRLYGRIAQEVREHGVMSRFPGRTEADLYLWIMDHRYFLSERYGFDVGSEVAAIDFGKRHAPSLPRRTLQRLDLLLHGHLAEDDRPPAGDRHPAEADGRPEDHRERTE